MADRYSAGLDDQDELSQFPSAANPLTALGIDPDMARANPELLAALQPQQPASPSAPQQTNGPLKMPDIDTSVDRSAANAGEVGGAGETTANTETPTTASDYAMAGLKGITQNLSEASKSAGEISTENPEIDRLSAQRSKLTTPAPLFNPSTGKRLSQTQEYDPDTGQTINVNPKPSAGSRVWRGVRGGLIGLATGGIPGAVVGALEPQDIRGGTAYGAPSGAYTKAETRREEQLGSTDADLVNAFKAAKDKVDAQKTKNQAYLETAKLGGTLATLATSANDINKAGTDAKRAATEQQRVDQESPASKLELSRAQFDQRTAQAAKIPTLSPLNRTLYILNGKIPDPREPNEAEITAENAARALTVFKLQHNGQGPQTLEDFNAIQASARGALDRGQPKNRDNQVSAIVADATGKKQKIANNYKRLKDGRYQDQSKPLSPPVAADQFAAAINQPILDANKDLAKMGASIDMQTGAVVRNNAAAPSGTTSATLPEAPVGTRRQGPNGIEVKTGPGKWEKQ